MGVIKYEIVLVLYYDSIKGNWYKGFFLRFPTILMTNLKFNYSESTSNNSIVRSITKKFSRYLFSVKKIPFN